MAASAAHKEIWTHAHTMEHSSLPVALPVALHSGLQVASKDLFIKFTCWPSPFLSNSGSFQEQPLVEYTAVVI